METGVILKMRGIGMNYRAKTYKRLGALARQALVCCISSWKKEEGHAMI